VSNINEIDKFFLKKIKEELLPEYKLPVDCISIEHKDDRFLFYYVMKEIPFEVYFNRYEILEELIDECKMLSKTLKSKKIHEMKVYVDYANPKKNLLLQI